MALGTRAATVFAAAACACAAPLEAALRDEALVGSGGVAYLDGVWQASDLHGRTMPGSVPGDVLTDLQAAGLIGDPFHGNNFLDKRQQALWYNNSWTYSTTVQLQANVRQVLVFDGIKMGATIRVDGKPIGTALDQFLRYEFLLPQAAEARKATVEVVFDWLNVDRRWMACSGGWDWAPYTLTRREGANSFSYGLWKSVYVVSTKTAASPLAFVTHASPRSHYLMSSPADYPIAPLTVPHRHQDFRVSTNVFALAAPSSSEPVTLRVTAAGAWGASNTTTSVLAAGKTVAGASGLDEHRVEISLVAEASKILLWWPNGMGAQTLYNVTYTFEARTGSGAFEVVGSCTRTVGFKVFTVSTGKGDDAEYIKENWGKDGTDVDGMIYRVNGASIFARGGNMIPMEEMEGRQTALAYHNLVKSAADTGMNVFRVWGGGVFLPGLFYSLCDAHGILLYHDMMYAQGSHEPLATLTQDGELRHQVRRLTTHVSVAMWDGCNECTVILHTHTGIYATFVLTVVAEEDDSRVIWPSCPSAGWVSGVDRITALPNGSPLGLNPRSGSTAPVIETHGPYQHTSRGLFPTINAGPFMNGTYTLPPVFKAAPTGTSVKNVFASEFGGVTMTSFESIAPTLDSAHWAMHGAMAAGTCTDGIGQYANYCTGDNVMQQRNYGCDSVMLKFFGWSNIAEARMNVSSADLFRSQLYLCMLAQALDLKSNIEERRSTNEYGTIIWQLNEIWPTGGWGSIEYGAVGQAGIVPGGRWKPLNYFYKKHLFTDVVVSCGVDGSGSNTDAALSSLFCYVKNNQPFDAIAPNSTVVLAFRDISAASGAPTVATHTLAGGVPRQGGTAFFSVPLPQGVAADTHVAEVAVHGGGSVVLAENVCPLSYPRLWKVNRGVHVAAAVRAAAETTTAGSPAPLAVEVEATGGCGLYVHLSTEAYGRFEDDAFLLCGKRVLLFYPFADNQRDALEKTLRVVHLAAALA